MKRHTPTPEEIKEAVSKAFRSSAEAIDSTSHQTGAVVPRAAYIYLLRVRSLMTPKAIAEETGKDEKWIRYSIRSTMGRARVDSDFAFMIWEAEKMILGITEKHIITNP